LNVIHIPSGWNNAYMKCGILGVGTNSKEMSTNQPFI
jgi:hypothetical protein